MLSINTIARVAVNVIRSASQPTSFDTGLLLVKDSSYTAAKRLRSYETMGTVLIVSWTRGTVLKP